MPDFINLTLLKHFPKGHWVAAGALASAMVLLALLPATPSHGTTRIPISPAVSHSPAIEFESFGTEAKEANTAERADATENRSQMDAVEFTVKSGDTLSKLFAEAGLSDREMFSVFDAVDEANILNRLHPGYRLKFELTSTGTLDALDLEVSALETYRFQLVNGVYQSQHIERNPELRQVFRHGSITDSLFMAGQRESIPTTTIMEMANIFGGVIDFILDPRLGDHFSLLFEEKYLEGELIGTGDIIAAQFTNQGRQYIAIRYTDSTGKEGYYSVDGESMRKPFLRTPLDVFRISSNFNPARRHPILNTIRAHKGTDYAAPTGTPVRATSDGAVTWAARSGSFGKLIVLKHNGGFETKYAHLSDFAKGIKKGARVRQGDVIGYVGATGGATGPHLHYEFLVNGVHQNPRTILDSLPQTSSIDPEEFSRFKQESEAVLQKFNALERSRILAMSAQSAE